MEQNETSQKVRDAFNLISAQYDNTAMRFFIQSAQELVNLLDLVGTEQLLDVAAGTGNVALYAARKLDKGSVTGVDLSPKMLDIAKLKAQKLQLYNLSFECCDMENLSHFKQRFDIATCAFGLFFVDDMLNALDCIKQCVKPGGCIGLTSFTGEFMDPMRTLFYAQAEEKYGITPHSQNWIKLNTKEKVHTLLKQAGFRKVKISSKQLGYYLEDINMWWDIVSKSGWRMMLNLFPAESIETFKGEHLASLRDFVPDR